MEDVSKKRPLLNFGVLRLRKKKTKEVTSDIQRTGIIGVLGSQKKLQHASHAEILRILNDGTPQQRRRLSRYFFATNGRYNRALRYLADLYRYDYLVYPILDVSADISDKEAKRISKRYNEVLEFFDNSSVQLMSRQWSIKICVDGVYYGYLCDDIKTKLVVQDLPIDYCRTRFYHQGNPLVEFNMEYFDKVTADLTMREKILALFPQEFQDGYKKYREGLLGPETMADRSGWVLLDPTKAFKLSFNPDDIFDTPPLAYTIPSLLNLDEVGDLNKEKMLQNIQKILVQEFELDSNGQLPFAMPELEQLNANAEEVIDDAVGVKVLSTVAKVDVKDLNSDVTDETESNYSAAEDDVYATMGISANLFNADGNISLEKSAIVDAGFMKPVLLQFEAFLNRFIANNIDNKKSKFRLKMLHNTIFNDQDLSDKYKDLTKIGFSRFLPMIALGHSQKEICSMAILEQQIMQLDAYMLPPFSSNTMSSDTWSDIKTQQTIIQGGKSVQTSTSSDKGGRPELKDDQKSDKTIANRASQ